MTSIHDTKVKSHKPTDATQNTRFKVKLNACTTWERIKTS